LVTEDSDVRFGAGRPEYEGLEFGFSWHDSSENGERHTPLPA
jgi:hypothetical protein